MNVVLGLVSVLLQNLGSLGLLRNEKRMLSKDVLTVLHVQAECSREEVEDIMCESTTCASYIGIDT